jgi:hypothetical protein
MLSPVAGYLAHSQFAGALIASSVKLYGTFRAFHLYRGINLPAILANMVYLHYVCSFRGSG